MSVFLIDDYFVVLKSVYICLLSRFFFFPCCLSSFLQNFLDRCVFLLTHWQGPVFKARKDQRTRGSKHQRTPLAQFFSRGCNFFKERSLLSRERKFFWYHLCADSIRHFFRNTLWRNMFQEKPAPPRLRQSFAALAVIAFQFLTVTPKSGAKNSRQKAVFFGREHFDGSATNVLQLLATPKAMGMW